MFHAMSLRYLPDSYGNWLSFPVFWKVYLLYQIGTEWTNIPHIHTSISNMKSVIQVIMCSPCFFFLVSLLMEWKRGGGNRALTWLSYFKRTPVLMIVLKQKICTADKKLFKRTFAHLFIHLPDTSLFYFWKYSRWLKQNIKTEHKKFKILSKQVPKSFNSFGKEMHFDTFFSDSGRRVFWKSVFHRLRTGLIWRMVSSK